MNIGTGRRSGAAVVLLACAATWACGEDPVAPELIGWFSLSTVEERTLPAPLPCSNDSILSSLLYLGSDRSAGYSFALKRAAGDTVTFEGNGSFDESATRVVVTIQGRWTGGDVETASYEFERIDMTLRRRLGIECDASAEADYLPALVQDASR